MIRIGYFLQNQDLIEKITHLTKYDSQFLIYELKNGDEKEIRNLKIDLMIFDFYGNDRRRLENFEHVKESLRIKGICIVDEYSDELISMVIKHHIQHICDRSQSERGFYVMILQMMFEDSKFEMSLHEQIEGLCKKRHLPSHFKGTLFIQTALLYRIENETEDFKMKEVYDTIAKKHHTTSSRVEKNMRMAIKQSGSDLSNARFVNDCYKEWLNG